MRAGRGESAPTGDPEPAVLVKPAAPDGGAGEASGAEPAGTRTKSTEPTESAAVGSCHELYVRRSFAVAGAVASLSMTLLISEVFVGETAQAPKAVLVAYVVVAVLPVVVAAVVGLAVLSERLGRSSGVAVVDRAWRALAVADLVWYVGFALAWSGWRIMSDSAAALNATSAMTFMLIVTGVLGAAALPPYWGVKGVVCLAPLQLALNADPGGGLSSGAYLSAGYHGVFALTMVGALEWLRGRARQLDGAERDRGAEDLVLARERAATLARRRAEDFIHDDILSALVPVATGNVSGAPVSTAARRALEVLADAREPVAPASAAELLEVLRAEAASLSVPVRVEGLGTGRPLPAEVGAAMALAAREALRNSVRHADPDGKGVRRIVLVEADGAGIRVVVRDEGVGFDVDSVAARHGLVNSITRRAADAGVGARLSTSPEGGTVVSLTWAETTAQEGPEPVERLLETRGARLIAGLLVAFHAVSTVVHWRAYTTPWVSPLCFLALLVCSGLVLRSWPQGMPRWAAWLVAAVAATADAVQLTVLVSRSMPGWDHWTTGAVLFFACGLLIRGRAIQAWAAMVAVMVGTLVWMAATGGTWVMAIVYCGGHVVTLAVWYALVVWAQRTHRALGVQEAWARAARRQQWVEAETRRVMAVTREHVARRARPVLERIAAGGRVDGGLRREALVLEAELRDEIRAACFTGTAVPLAAGCARRRGVEVVLFDDSDGCLGRSELDRVVQAVVKVLEGCRSGQVVVRVPPVSRREVVVATHDGHTVLRLDR